jgi:predicted permease
MKTFLQWLGPAHLIDHLGTDLRFSLRNLKKHALLSMAVVITLAFGLGLNTGVFTLIDAVLFRAHVDKNLDTFFRVRAYYSDGFVQGLISLPDYQAYLADTRSARELAAWDDVWTTLGTGVTTSVRAALTSCNFFSVYGLDRPESGRFFFTDECSPSSSAPVAVVSNELWRTQFEADPHILGRVIRVGRTALTIVGVTPPRFSGRVKGINIWIPYSMLSQFENESWLTVEGRLNSGYSRADAQAEFRVIAQRQDLLHPHRKTTLVVTNGSVIAEPHLGMAIWVVVSIMGALALVTLISCTNVSALLLSRAAARRREIGIRLSLGAGRDRLLQMLLTESLVLATIGGVIGAFLAWEVPTIIVGIIPFVDPPAYSLKPDWIVFLYLTGITLAAGCLAGLAPIAESLKADLGTSIKGSESCFACGVKNGRTLELLIASQIAMSLVLLVAAAICVRAQYTMFAAGPGFEIQHVLAVRIDSVKDGWALRHTLGQRLKAVPGLMSVCFAEFLPFERKDTEDVRTLSQPAGTGRLVSTNFVSPNYFEALGIPIVRGRAFGDGDVTTDYVAPVAIVSAAFARQFWPGEDALGKVIEVPERLQIVGVSRDSRSARYGEQDGPQLFRLQNPKASSGSLMVRFQGDVSTVRTGISTVLHEMGSSENSRPVTLKWMMDTSASAFWAIAEMILFLAIAAVGLAVVGTYGVAAFAAERRTKEFGIRIALGAVRVDIIRLVLRSGAKPIALGLLAGICTGVGASHALGRLIENAPFVLDMHDPLAYFCVSLLLVSSSIIATIIPALRATTANPIHALHEE